MIYNFDGIKNVRELGGLKTADGKIVKSNMLFRTAELSNATEEDIKRLCDFGIKEIFDFRDSYEVNKDPDLEVPTAKNHHLPALPPLAPYDDLSDDELKELFEQSVEKIFKIIYKDLAESENAISAYKKFFEIILSSNGAPILWHCTQGKDRTGVGAILLLTALGVPLDAVMEEYFITNEVMQTEFERAVTMGADPITISTFKTVMFVHKECIDIYIDSITKNYGSIGNFIKTALNVSEDAILKLQDWYLE